MPIPCKVQVTLGENQERSIINENPLVTDELKDKLGKLLMGQYVTSDGSCTIHDGIWNEDNSVRSDTLCVTADLVVVEIEYCTEIGN